ncbi:MAG: hypothetical protein P1U58_15920 [Verrucomicrobiales bacterium]|nr:hypothetical protein [Verrucomicrobiales bacterium]
MASKTRQTASESRITQERFLRSINVTLDAGDAGRIAHFFPTAKSVGLIENLLGHTEGREFLVTAPYGSGKSLASTFALQLVENRGKGRAILSDIASRMFEVNDASAQAAIERIEKGDQGLGLALEGAVESLPLALAKAAIASLKRLGKKSATYPVTEISENSSLEDAMVALKDSAEKASADRVVIYWDEFGRHLEYLVSEGLTGNLHDLQTLAERVSRQKKIPTVLSLFLHQGFMDYGKKLPSGAKREWKKIEGRFQTLDYIEDSKEIYRLLGEIVSSRKSRLPCPIPSKIASVAKTLKAQGLWSNFTAKELSEIFKKAWPLNPATLALLPKIAARVSQNERTLFTFLFTLDLDKEVTPSDLYDFFSDQMRTDSEAGGTFRQWLETESALSKAQTIAEEEALKTCCLMSLGSSGQRHRVNFDQVVSAYASYDSRADAENTIESLVARKLLLHRKHSDEVSIWHGADLDLRTKLEDEKQRLSTVFNLNEFLERECLPPCWRPREHNDRFGINRYFESIYFRAQDFLDHLNIIRPEVLELDSDTDGRICYLLGETADEIMQARKAIDLLGKTTDAQNKRVVFALPSEPLQIRDAATEVAALSSMERDASLIESDPLVLPEIKQMLDDSRLHLKRLVDKLVVPSANDTDWIYCGQEFKIESIRQLEIFLSAITDRNYPDTPVIQNELIVKKKPTPVMVNSRKKALLALLERTGKEGLGITGNFPDAAIFRTVLLNTGLYAPSGTGWGFTKPSAIQDPGLAKAWELMEDFFRDPCPEGRSPRELFDTLQAPPYGVRAGILPVLFAAGLKAFAISTSLMKDGEYIADVLPSVIEELCKQPERFSVKVLALDPDTVHYLEDLRHLFCQQKYVGDESDLLRKTFEALHAWLRQLPEAARETRQLSKPAKDLRNALLRSSDPVFLLLTRIPQIFIGASRSQIQKDLAAAKTEIESVTDKYRETAAKFLRRALQVPDSDKRTTSEAARDWAKSFSKFITKSHPDHAILMRMQFDYESDAQLIDSLSDLSKLSPCSVSRWGDGDVDKFSTALAESIRSVEDFAFGKDLSSLKPDKTESKGMIELIQSRIEEALHKLKDVGGEELAAEFLASLSNAAKQKKKRSS